VASLVGVSAPDRALCATAKQSDYSSDWLGCRGYGRAGSRRRGPDIEGDGSWITQRQCGAATSASTPETSPVSAS
jgi:hypothetical protein